MLEKRERSFFLPLLIVGVLLLGVVVVCVMPLVDCALCEGSAHLVYLDGELDSPGNTLLSRDDDLDKFDIMWCNRCNKTGETSLLKNWLFDPSKPPKLEELELSEVFAEQGEMLP